MELRAATPQLPVASAGFERLPAHAFDQLVRCREAIKAHDLLGAREAVEDALTANPESFVMNAMHGEVLYRLGYYRLSSQALFRAMVQPPTSWASYQVVSHLYQESRHRERSAFERAVVPPPPKPIATAIYWLARRCRGLARFRRLEAVV